MSILDTINKAKNKFQQKKAKAERVRLNRNMETAKEQYKNAKIKRSLEKQQRYIDAPKVAKREKLKKTFQSFAKKVQSRTKARGGRAVQFGRTDSPFTNGSSNNNIFTQSSGNDIYHKSNSQAGNIFNSLGSNPVRKAKKRTQRQVIIKL